MPCFSYLHVFLDGEDEQIQTKNRVSLLIIVMMSIGGLCFFFIVAYTFRSCRSKKRTQTHVSLHYSRQHTITVKKPKLVTPDESAFLGVVCCFVFRLKRNRLNLNTVACVPVFCSRVIGKGIGKQTLSYGPGIGNRACASITTGLL